MEKKIKKILEKGILKKDIVIPREDIKVAVIAITEKGKNTAKDIEKGLLKNNYIKIVDIFSKNKGIKEFIGDIFEKYDCIIFVSACGIAVRCIAPFLKNKFEDPAILVVDDNGNNVISLLSGHIGGANEISLKIANILNANPVITTSTDTNKKGALDLIAYKMGGYIEDFRNSVKFVNLCLVNDKKVGIYFDEIYEKEIKYLDLNGFEIILDKDEYLKKEDIEKLEVIVSVTDKIETNMDKFIKNNNINILNIRLIPRRVVLGMGCRKNTETNLMIEEFEKFSAINNIHPAAIFKTGSFIIKKDELCMKELSKILCSDFEVFSVEEISKCDYLFEKSEFVKEKIGVYSVAQPSAYLLSKNVITEKYKSNGITFAFGRKDKFYA